MYKIILLFFIIAFTVKTEAQPFDNKVLKEKFELYHKAHPPTKLFVHIDKTVYTNNEKIWFGAYLINHFENRYPYSFLSVFLTRSDSRQIILAEKFKLQDGLSLGSILLPDTIPPGSYLLTSYTSTINKDGFPVASFSLPIEIKNTTRQNFTANITLLDSVVSNNIVRTKVTVLDNALISKNKIRPVVSYSTGQGTEHSFILKGTETIITIPKEQLTGNRPVLLTTVRYGNEVRYFSTPLPVSDPKKISVRFYPEGGGLSDGIPCQVGWEAKTATGNPINVKGLLMKDNKVIDHLESNSLGVGKFRFIPTAASTYSLKISAGRYLKKDSTVFLPKIAATGIGLHLDQAAVNDTLMVSLYSREKKQVQILIHNYQGDYLLVRAMLTDNANNIQLPLQTLPRGLATITLLDEGGSPLAERLLFCHYRDSTSTRLQTDKSVYGKNDSVKIKLTLKDKSGKPLRGVFSAAVVQGSRLTGNFRDIETSIYLSQSLGQLPQDPSAMGFKNKEYLEDILLIKGWRKYTWQDLIAVKATDTLQNLALLRTKGNIKLHQKPLSSPVQVLALGGTEITLISTGNDGSFFLDPKQLISTSGNKIKLMVNNSKSNYEIHVDDPYQRINTQLSLDWNEEYHVGVTNNSNTADQDMKGLQNIINLQAVEIKASKNNSMIYGFKGEPGTNACGDYVDEAGHLNYEKSEHRFKPINGKLYMKRTDLEGAYFKVEPVYYTGCTTEEKHQGIAISGIYSGKEFYDAGNNSENPYGSTLYWRSGIMTNAAGEAEFTLRTDELADTFRIIVQGVTSDNLIYGTGGFNVK